jgi:hypothetical protein
MHKENHDIIRNLNDRGISTTYIEAFLVIVLASSYVDNPLAVPRASNQSLSPGRTSNILNSRVLKIMLEK